MFIDRNERINQAWLPAQSRMNRPHGSGCQCADCAVNRFGGLSRTPTPRLSDEDVRRIAREVVRQLQRSGHDPGDEDPVGALP